MASIDESSTSQPFNGTIPELALNAQDYAARADCLWFYSCEEWWYRREYKDAGARHEQEFA